MFQASESNLPDLSQDSLSLHPLSVKNVFQKNLPQINISRPQESATSNTLNFETNRLNTNSGLFSKFGQKTTPLVQKRRIESIIEQRFAQEAENREIHSSLLSPGMCIERSSKDPSKSEIKALISNFNQRLQNIHNSTDPSPINSENPIHAFDENSISPSKSHPLTIGNYAKSALLPLRERNLPTKARTLLFDSPESHHKTSGGDSLMQNILNNIRGSNHSSKSFKQLDRSTFSVSKPSEPSSAIIKTEKRNFSGKQNVHQINLSQQDGETGKKGFCKNLFARHFSNEDEEEEEDKSYVLLQGPAKKLFLNSGSRFGEQLNELNASTADNSRNASNRSSNEETNQPKFIQSTINSMEYLEDETKNCHYKVQHDDKIIPSPTLSSQNIQVFVPDDVGGFLSEVCMFKNSKTEGASSQIGSCFSLDSKPAQSMQPDSPLIPSRFKREYQQFESLGSGNSGKVYRCVGRVDGGEYAVKIMPQRKRGISRVDKALNEIRVHAALGQEEDSAFVQYHGSWEEEASFYLVMEYCPSTLKNIGTLGIKTSESMIRNVLRDVSQGLKQLHKMNLAHLDIKPENILYSKNERFKISDLGLSRVADRAPGEDVDEGDSRYLAPEFLNDFANVTQTQSVLKKADIFSLGVTLYELMIKEEMPKNGEEWHSIRRGTLPKLANLIHYSDSLKRIVSLMMSADPLLRPSAEEILSNFLPCDMELELKWEKTEKAQIKTQMMGTMQQFPRSYTV